MYVCMYVCMANRRIRFLSLACNWTSVFKLTNRDGPFSVCTMYVCMYACMHACKVVEGPSFLMGIHPAVSSNKCRFKWPQTDPYSCAGQQ